MNRNVLCLLLVPLIVIMIGAMYPAQAVENDQSVLPDLNAIRVLDLTTAGKIALAGNPSLQAAQARVIQAKERVLQARSTYWPWLDATASASRVALSDNDYQTNLAYARLINPTATVKDPEEYYKAQLAASWVLFNGFERKFSNAAARYGESQSESAGQESKRLLLSAVAASYFAGQLALENISIAKADETFNQRQLLEAKVRRQVGTGSLSDELNFEIRVNSAKTERIEAERVYEAAMFGLAALLGIPDATFPAGLKLAELENETPAELTPPDSEPLIGYARLHRPDILQNDFALKQAAAETKIARARFFPTVNLSASVDGDRSGNARFEQDDFGNTIGAYLSYNLFSGGADLAKLNEAKAKQTEAEKTLQNVMIQVNSEVHTAASKLNSVQNQVVLQRSNTALVRRTRDLVEKEYAAGQGSLVRLNEAQRDLITAQSRLSLALVSLRQAWFDLETVTGQSLLTFAD